MTANASVLKHICVNKHVFGAVSFNLFRPFLLASRGWSHKALGIQHLLCLPVSTVGACCACYHICVNKECCCVCLCLQWAPVLTAIIFVLTKSAVLCLPVSTVGTCCDCYHVCVNKECCTVFACVCSGCPCSMRADCWPESCPCLCLWRNCLPATPCTTQMWVEQNLSYPASLKGA